MRSLVKFEIRNDNRKERISTITAIVRMYVYFKGIANGFFVKHITRAWLRREKYKLFTDIQIDYFGPLSLPDEDRFFVVVV